MARNKDSHSDRMSCGIWIHEPERTPMHHRAYQSLFPTKNKYLQQKWDKASYNLHRSKVTYAKPAIDIIPPKTYPHLALKLKKQQLEEERALEIQLHNNILLEKIARIKRTKGAVDSWNDYEPKRTTEPYQPLFPTQSKYLQQKWDKSTYDLHRRKVKSSKPVIDIRTPRVYPHLEQRLKKQQMEEERAMDIQRENNLLHEKIAHIKRTTGGVDSWNNFEKKRPTNKYEAYQSLFPTANRYLQHKWDKSVYDLRRRKVTSAKPAIDTTSPRTFPHLEQRLKTKQLEEERKMEIHRENSILMEKIAHINRTTGEIDTSNKFSKDSPGRKQLQREMLRMSLENQLKQFRLSQCRAQYNAQSLHDDWLKHLKVMDNMTHYPRGSSQKGHQKHGKHSHDSNKEKTKHTNPPAPLTPKEEPVDHNVKTEPELQQDTVTDSTPETDPPGNPDS